jgi:hypothetical protein
VCDLSDNGQLSDGVFYNDAFYDHQHDSLELDDAAWEASMTVNLMSRLVMARLTLPQMLEMAVAHSYSTHPERP